MRKPPTVKTPLVWHESHDALVTTCPAGLPSAIVPLWQFAHCPVGTGLCVNVVDVMKLVTLPWQVPQSAETVTGCGLMTEFWLVIVTPWNDFPNP